MLISIITVNLNNAQGLEKTIQSVINQKFKDYEFIIIDGGSTDGSLETIKKYQDKITYWISEKDKGIYYAMNKGIDKAIGEWINFLNSGDCYFDMFSLKKTVKTLQSTNADLVYGNICILSDNNNSPIIIESQIIKNYWKGMFVNHQALFTKSSIMSRYKFRENYFKIVADYDFVYRVKLDNHQFKKINQIITIQEPYGLSAKNELKTLLETYYVNRLNSKLLIKQHYHYLKEFLICICKDTFLIYILIFLKKIIKFLFKINL